MALKAHCPDCDRTFRVPHADRTWNCKGCGGALDLLEPEAPRCPECDAEVEVEAAFCEACGFALREDTQVRSRSEKKAAGAEMRKAMKRVRRLKTYLWFTFCGNGCVLLLTSLFVLTAEAQELTGLAYVVVGLYAVLLALNGLALHQLERRPFPAVLGMALLWTLLTSLDLLAGSINLFGIALTVWVWFVLSDVARMTRLAKEHPDLYLSKRLRGEHLSGSHGAGESLRARRREREAARSRGSGLRLAGIFGGVLLLLGLGTWGYRVSAAPSSVETTLEEFQAAWNRVDTQAIGDLAVSDRQETWKSNVEKLQRRYEWGSSLPPLDAFRVTGRGETRVTVDFSGPAGILSAKFRWKDGRWCLHGLDMRGVKDWRP